MTARIQDHELCLFSHCRTCDHYEGEHSMTRGGCLVRFPDDPRPYGAPPRRCGCDAFTPIETDIRPRFRR